MNIRKYTDLKLEYDFRMSHLYPFGFGGGSSYIYKDIDGLFFLDNHILTEYRCDGQMTHLPPHRMVYEFKGRKR